MNNNDYLLPGIAAILLVVLFPSYWIHALAVGDLSIDAALSIQSGLSVADWVFLVVGMLCVYVYYGLSRLLIDHQNYSGVNVLLVIMMCATALYYGGLFILDYSMGLAADSSAGDYMLAASVLIFGSSIVIFGLLEIIIGVLLIKDAGQVPRMVKAFAIATLIDGIFAITVFLSFATILIFPISMLFLALVFLKKPEMIEVV